MFCFFEIKLKRFLESKTEGSHVLRVFLGLVFDTESAEQLFFGTWGLKYVENFKLSFFTPLRELP